MYVAVKGGERAIENAHALLADVRRGDRSIPELTLDQIEQQLALAVDRVMGEGSLYDRELAALAIKQAQGDLIEAVFLLRAYRTTLPRFAYSLPLETSAMRIERRVSSVFKDLPGGQLLGPTYDYTHRLLDFSLAADTEPARAAEAPADPTPNPATSRANRCASPPRAMCACRRWRAATRVFSSASAIRRSAAGAARTPSPAKSAWARSPSKSSRPSSVSQSISATSPSPNARW